jgi:hypothetical protein
VRCCSHLPHLVLAGAATSRFPGGLHRWQKQSHQDSDDRNHNEQFDERETTATVAVRMMKRAWHISASR